MPGTGYGRGLHSDVMDCLTYLHIDGNGVCEFQNPAKLADVLRPPQIRFLLTAIEQTCRAIHKWNRPHWTRLAGRTLHLRFCEDPAELVMLTPHEILIDLDLLNYTSVQRTVRRQFLIGLLEKAFFEQCHSDWHASRITHHSLAFLAAHPRLHEAARQEWEARVDLPGREIWLEVLQARNEILALEGFWFWLGEQEAVATILKAKRTGRRRELIVKAAQQYAQEHAFSDDALEQVSQCRFLSVLPGTAVLIYKLGRHARKVVRIGPSGVYDTMAAPAACFSSYHASIRTDIFYDHGRYIAPWLERLDRYRRDPTLMSLAGDLLSDNVHTVQAALVSLTRKVRRKDHAPEALRLLYAALYYWGNDDKGVCRAMALRVNKVLEDMLTERPIHFPPTRTNRTVFRGEPATVTVQVTKPHRVKREYLRVQIQWCVNGNKKRALPMTLDKTRSRGQALTYTVELPVRRGWIHYATRLSLNEGKKWRFENYDPNAQGLIKYVADERGQRVLSCYADTFNLRLNSRHEPVRDTQGAYVYGSFDTLAEQLEGIRAEGFTRIYPLGTLELGWAGEAGPDPSVFSIWDGVSIRRDMGGLPALLRLRDEADRLGMKIILCVVSHFARANNDHPYHFPVYIQNAEGQLTRRAGWDGEWDEWLDSFMVNMRDFDNVRILAELAEELATLGFGLRIDVGHGFDTVFPISTQSPVTSQLLGEVCAPGFIPADLRGSWQANAALLYLCYRVQCTSPNTPVIYAEQWHGNEVRMIQSGATPYNSLIKNLEHIRAGAEVMDEMGLNENLLYLHQLLDSFGGQSLSLFNSHDEESPTSNYQNMIWPVAAFLVFSSYGPLAYHISRLPGEEVGSFRQRFDQAYLECWKHWVNNRFSHPWVGEENARQQLLDQYPLLKGFGAYLRNLFGFVDGNPVLTKGALTPICTNHGRIAAFIRSQGDQIYLCVFNFPDAHAWGQQAVPRKFNFALKRSVSHQPIGEIQAGCFYEIKERYNNVEGRRRRGKKEFWSGTELLHLGFGGTLPPVSSHVYEIVARGANLEDALILPDSFLRYFEYGKEYRVKYTYVAQVFRSACEQKRGGFKKFFELFVTVVTWIRRDRKLGVADIATLLAEITEQDAGQRQVVVGNLMRIAVHRQKSTGNAIRETAADVLHALEVGTVVMVSPESRFSGSSGGVGLYTTDIADVLSEMGFHVVIVTPLYEQNRSQIFHQYGPKYEGHQWSLRFPTFDEGRQSLGEESETQIVNFLRTKLNRFTHGKRSRVEVIYLENAAYFDVPYGGDSAEDKLRRARVFSQGAIEALRAFNYYPAIIQTNEWPTWLVSAYLTKNHAYRTDPHFARTQTFSMMHNPHPAYSIVLKETNPRKACYYAKVLDFDPVADFDMVFRPDSGLQYDVDLTHIMLKSSPYMGTVSNAMRQRILDEPWLFGHAGLFQSKASQGRFFSRRNGFNMAARQRFWFGSKKSLLETSNRMAKRRLFHRYTKIKSNAKLLLQEDPHIRLHSDSENQEHVIFGMLHRICRQKGFELLVDWKVRTQDGYTHVTCDSADMQGPTVLEHFLDSDPRIQFVICGRVEDSFDGRRYHMQLERIAHDPRYQGRFAYYPEGALPPSLYRNLYLGCQYFVMPSGGEVGEPCGISQQEAHAGGTPVIAHHQDGLQKTVCDGDFGDTGFPSNGIKFSGFTGDALLEAMGDAVSIYFEGERRLYRDRHGRARPLLYADLSFNAFCTDHRWLRLLRDYVRMYAHMLGITLPAYLDAVQLIVDINSEEEKTPGDAVLRRGLTVPEARKYLQETLFCSIASVRFAAEKALRRLETTGSAAEKKNPHCESVDG